MSVAKDLRARYLRNEARSVNSGVLSKMDSNQFAEYVLSLNNKGTNRKLSVTEEVSETVTEAPLN